LPSLFEASCRLPTSATETRRASKTTGTLDPRRDGGLNLLPFLRRATPSPLRKRWHAASRAASERPTPVLVPPTRVGLPNRDAGAPAPPRRRFWRPVCSEDRRARVEGPSEGRVCRTHATISRACVGCMSFVAHARRRSPPRRPSDIRCRRRAVRGGRMPATARRTDLGLRSDDAPRRAPPSRRPGCLRPPRHVRECLREGIAPSGPHAGSLAHAAHTFSPKGKVLLKGIARSRCGHPRSVNIESTDAFSTRWTSRAWD